MWNEFLPISMPVTATAELSFWDMACSLSGRPLTSLSLVGQEHGRTIPLADLGTLIGFNLFGVLGMPATGQGNFCCQRCVPAPPTKRSGPASHRMPYGQLPRVPRVPVEVGLLLVDLGLVAAGEDVASDPPHVPAAAAVEDQHAAEQLQHGQKARVGVVRMHTSAPLAAEREHLAVEPTHDLVVVAEQRVVAAQVDHVALEPVELGPAVVQPEERHVLRPQPPL